MKRVDRLLVGGTWRMVVRRLWMTDPRLGLLAAVVAGTKVRINGPGSWQDVDVTRP